MSATLAATVWSTGVAVVSLRTCFSWTRRPVRGRAVAGDVLLIRPCAGSEPDLARTLRSIPRQIGARALAVRFAVGTADDQAAAIATAAAAALVAEGFDARVVVTFAMAPNRKADQVARLLAKEPRTASLVAVADSDVDLADVDLEALLSPLATPRTGAVWAAPVEVAPATLGDRASAAVLDASLHAFPLLATLDPHEIVGKLLVVRREALDEVGGFAALTHLLGEDLELGRLLRSRGYRVVRAPLMAFSRAQGRTFRGAVDRYARWLLVIRAQRPWVLASYPALLFATFPLLGLSLVAVALDGSRAWWPFLLAIVARAGVACVARLRTGRPLALATLGRDIVLADALLGAAFLSALSNRRTVWRGLALRVEPGGGLSPADSTRTTNLG